MNSLTLRIAGVSSAHCARSLEQALNALPGIEARVNSEQGLAEVHGRGALQIEPLLRAVRAKGYDAEPLARGQEPAAVTRAALCTSPS